MHVMRITTPDGHKACLEVRHEEDYSRVCVCMGNVSTAIESGIPNDVSLIATAIKTFDDLMMNLKQYSPAVIDDGEKGGMCCISPD